jgi:hypothetical protein
MADLPKLPLWHCGHLWFDLMSSGKATPAGMTSKRTALENLVRDGNGGQILRPQGPVRLVIQMIFLIHLIHLIRLIRLIVLQIAWSIFEHPLRVIHRLRSAAEIPRRTFLKLQGLEKRRWIDLAPPGLCIHMANLPGVSLRFTPG